MANKVGYFFVQNNIIVLRHTKVNTDMIDTPTLHYTYYGILKITLKLETDFDNYLYL